QDPDFWLDTRADPGHGPVGDMTARGPLQPEPNNHQPSIAYQSYLVTGDRFFLDEMCFWANYSLIGTYQDAHYNLRGGGRSDNLSGLWGTAALDQPGSWGLLAGNEVRGVAWGLRVLADAASYLPDADPLKTYFADKIANNLAWHDGYAASHTTPLGTFFD